MAGNLTIRNLTSARLSLDVVERIQDPVTNGWSKFLFGSKKDGPYEPSSNELENVNTRIAPFTTQDTQIAISSKSGPGEDDNGRLRLTFSDRGGKHSIDFSTTSYTTQDFTSVTTTGNSFFGLYFGDGFLAIFSKTALASWMKAHSDDTPLSALSIPGTHNSPTCHRALFSVRCQAVSLKEQLEHGIRFFDLRLQVDDPDNKNSNDLTLVHSNFPIALSGSKKFKPLYDEILEFLRNNPSETIILSLKREGSGNATDSNLAQRLYDHYINRENWVADRGIPTLGKARGKLVLFRRFKLNEETRKLYGTASGINAAAWADNTANSRSGDVQIQDLYEVRETANIESKAQHVCDHCERAASEIGPFGITSAGQEGNRGPLFVNFLSASYFWRPGCWPENIAAKVNPAVTEFLCKKFGTDASAKSGAPTGVMVCDWIGQSGDWDLVKAIIGMNERLLIRDIEAER